MAGAESEGGVEGLAVDGASPVSATARAQVLVIDDEPRVGELLVKLLSPSFDASHELRASTALALIKAGARYDVILCDLMMPEITGMDVQAVLERDVPELASRTVFMTGGAFTERAQQFLDRFEGRILEKPFRMADVQRVVCSMLDIGRLDIGRLDIGRLDIGRLDVGRPGAAR